MKNSYYANSQDYINRWVVSYADFVTLLLALFIVMYALSQMNSRNVKDFSHSVNKVFATTQTYGKIDKRLLKKKNKLDRIFKTTKVDITTVNISSKSKASVKHISSIQIENNFNKDYVEFNNIKALIQKKVKYKDGISITQEPRGLVIQLKNNLLFDSGSDIIKGKARITLDELAGVLKNIPNSLRIEGHTDDAPINTSKFPSNWELSTARAVNIIKYLVNKHNFNPSRLSAVGYGQFNQIKASSDASIKSMNRRVDIVILTSNSKILEANIK